jgi:Holliday junction resolvase RusA-like endonuclease
MTTLEVTLTEIPPSLNNLYANVEIEGKSRRVLSSAANDWKRSAAWTIKAAAMEQGWTCEKKVPLFVEVFYASPSVLRWDLDGKPKLLLDALCEAFGLDDRYVMTLNQMKARSGLEQVRLRVMKGEIEL